MKFDLSQVTEKDLEKKKAAKEIYEKTKCNAISFASVLHYKKLNINEIKKYLAQLRRVYGCKKFY